jgi:uncharacterized membrane protein
MEVAAGPAVGPTSPAKVPAVRQSAHTLRLAGLRDTARGRGREGNLLVVLIELYNWYSRYQHGADAVLPTGLILSLIVVLILLFTGWKGWEWFIDTGSE